MGAVRFGELITSLDLAKYEIFGHEYLQDTIRSTLRDNAYRYYLTDVLNAIAQNTSKAYGGIYMTKSYRELTDTTQNYQEVEEDTRPVLDIAHEIFAKIRRKEG